MANCWRIYTVKVIASHISHVTPLWPQYRFLRKFKCSQKVLKISTCCITYYFSVSNFATLSLCNFFKTQITKHALTKSISFNIHIVKINSCFKRIKLVTLQLKSINHLKSIFLRGAPLKSEAYPTANIFHHFSSISPPSPAFTFPVNYKTSQKRHYLPIAIALPRRYKAQPSATLQQYTIALPPKTQRTVKLSGGCTSALKRFNFFKSSTRGRLSEIAPSFSRFLWWTCVFSLSFGHFEMKGGFSMIWVVAGLLAAVAVSESTGAVVEKRSAASERASDDYPDYQSLKYDEYPVSNWFVWKCCVLHVLHAFLKLSV